MKFRRVPEEVDAIQWNKGGDHPQVFALTSPSEHAACGGRYDTHGHHGALGVVLCPGDWIVTDHGVTTIWKDADFRAAFEARHAAP